LVEEEAQREENALFQYAGGDPSVTDSPEINRPEPGEIGQVVLGEELARFEIALRPDIELLPVDIEGEAVCRCLEDFFALGNDLGANAIPSNHCDPIHVSTFSRSLAYATSPPASIISFMNGGTGSIGSFLPFDSI